MKSGVLERFYVQWILQCVSRAREVVVPGESSRPWVAILIRRYPDTPAELVIDLKDGEYLVIDAERQTKLAEQARLSAVLTPEPQSVEALAKLSSVTQNRVYGHMKALVGLGKANIEGKGVRRNPFLYSAVPVHSLSSDPLSLEAKAKENLGPPLTD